MSFQITPRIFSSLKSIFGVEEPVALRSIGDEINPTFDVNKQIVTDRILTFKSITPTSKLLMGGIISETQSLEGNEPAVPNELITRVDILSIFGQLINTSASIDTTVKVEIDAIVRIPQLSSGNTVVVPFFETDFQVAADAVEQVFQKVDCSFTNLVQSDIRFQQDGKVESIQAFASTDPQSAITRMAAHCRFWIDPQSSFKESPFTQIRKAL